MSFNVGSAANQQGSMVGSNYLVNLIELQNTVTSATGLTPIEQVQQEVNNIMAMVNFEQKRIFTNIISKYDTSPIQVTDDINLSNATIYQNGLPFSGAGGGTTGGGGVIVSSGGTSITLTNTSSPISTAMAFNVGGRTIFSFDGAGRALYYDPLGSGNRFWISSATLVADNLQVGGPGLGAYPGKFLQSKDLSGTSTWSYVSTLTTAGTGLGPFVSLSSGAILFGSGIGVPTLAGEIDSRRNWYLGNPSLTGNNDLVNSNDITVIGGGLRYQGGGLPVAGKVLAIQDSLGTVVLSNVGGGGLSSFVVGDQIQSGATSVRADGALQEVVVTQGVNTIAKFTGTGRFGISNIAPSATLDVGGDAIIRGPITINPGTGGIDYVLTASGIGGLGSWQAPGSIFSGTGSNQIAWRVNGSLSSIQGIFGGSEQIRLSSGGAYFGVSSPYSLNVSGIVAAAGFGSLSPLRFFIGASGSTGTEVARFLDNGNFGVGVTNPTFKLQVAGSQSNSGNLNLGGNLFVGGSATATSFSGNGSNITNIQTSNVGSGSNQLNIFQGVTRANILALQVSISSFSTTVFSTLDGYNINGGQGFFSTLSSQIYQTSNALSTAIGVGAGAVVSSYSTQVGIAMAAQFSTLSSYIVTNTSQFSTLSSVIEQVSFDDRAYASTIAYSTASTVFTIGLSTFLSTGGTFTGSLTLDKQAKLWISSGGKLGVGYKVGQDLSGTIDTNGLIYSAGLRGLASPFALGVGTSTTSKLIAGGYTSTIGWRMGLQGDLDISGLLYRNGQLYTLDGTPDVYWSRNGSNIWFADGNVGIGVYDPTYPLDVAGRIRCFGVDVIQGPGPTASTPQGLYVSPWQYQGSNIYYNLGGAGIGPGFSTVQNGVSWDVSGPVRIQNGTTYMSTLAVNIPYGSTLVATADIFGSLRAQSLVVMSTGLFGGRVTARDFLSLSDRRYKTNISPLEGSHSLLNGMRGVRFEWLDSGKADIGMIAQEVRTVLPEVVSGDEEGGFHMSYEKIVPILLEAVKDLRQRVDTLEKRLGQSV